MPKPTLLIGLGTSGLKVVEEVQHFHYENTGSNKPEHVEYLYLETDENSAPEVTAQENKIKRVHINLSDKETMINGLKRNSSIDDWWLPPAEQVLDSGVGAGGLPAFGRVALWGGANFDQVSSAIKNAWGNIANFNNIFTDDSKPAVFLTGSLTGGTASGIFIDMAYLIRDIIPDIEEVYGLFMIPGRQSYSGREIIYCNTYTSLKALEYFSDKANTYKVTWPNGTKANFSHPPFELVQFISQEYDGEPPPINTLSGLFKIAGLYLFLNIFGLREKRQTRLVDAKANKHIDKYGTFGLSAIQYPKSQLEEYLAIKLSMQLLQRWTDPNAYYSHGTKVQLRAAQASIHNETMQNFEGILREAFEQLDSVEVGSGNKVINDISKEAKKINGKEHNADSDDQYLLNLYSSKGSGNYYDALSNNVNLAQDVIVQRIQELISNSVEGYQNLHLAKLQLEFIVNAIDGCLNYWKSIKLSGMPNKWEILLDSQIKWMLKGRYKFLFEQNNVLCDRMKSTLELMKMHLLANKLVDIRNNMIKGEYAMKTFQDNRELPRLNRIDEIINVIRNTIGAEESKRGEVVLKTLKARNIEILDDVKDTSISILRIYPSGTFEEEAKKSLNKYVRDSNRSIPSKKTLIGDQNLWEYLKQSTDILGKNLYNQCISRFERELRNYHSIENLDVSEFVQKEPEEARKIARRATFALLKINPNRTTKFGVSMYVPKIIIGPDQSSINKVVEAFKNLNFTDFKNASDDDYFARKDLKNIIVFYDEKGYMDDRSNFRPLKDLRYIDEIESIYKEYPKAIGISEDDWHILRNPYIKKGTNNERNRNRTPRKGKKSETTA